MDYNIVTVDAIPIAEVDAGSGEIRTLNDALDLIGTVVYNDDSHHVILQAEHLDPAFFDLKTGIAGEILQKFTQYGMRLAVVGDFDHYESSSLQAFIRECNRGSQLFFCPNRDEARTRLSGGAS